jgi:hypothetical protein
MKFRAYIKLILPVTESIGIVTQPFEVTNQSRYFDATKNKKRCKELVSAFVEKVSESFPKARIRIHNGPNETITLAYARMIMAKQVIVSIGSLVFSRRLRRLVHAYDIRKLDYAVTPNRWLLSPPADELCANVVLFDEPNRLMTYEVKKLRELPGRDENVLDWFLRNDTY